MKKRLRTDNCIITNAVSDKADFGAKILEREDRNNGKDEEHADHDTVGVC